MCTAGPAFMWGPLRSICVTWWMCAFTVSGHLMQIRR